MQAMVFLCQTQADESELSSFWTTSRELGNAGPPGLFGIPCSDGPITPVFIAFKSDSFLDSCSACPAQPILWNPGIFKNKG